VNHSDHYDIVIIGTGAGGGTMARALASTGSRILVIERGDFFERHADNWDPRVVWIEQRYRTKERWLTAEGRDFNPYIHYGVGGNTKFWGGVLYRLREEDFERTRHADGDSPAWPITYEDLAPYYDRAEAMYHVHGQAGMDPTDPPRGPFPYPPIPHTVGMTRMFDRLRDRGLHPSFLPLGLIQPGEDDGCRLCDRCNSFPCMIGAKSDSETCGIEPVRREWPNVELRTRTLATRLIRNASGTRVIAVDVRRDDRDERIHGNLFIVACGAANSAALFLRSGSGFANSSGLVGRNYMAHLTTMFSAYPWEDVESGPHQFQKTIAINDYYRASKSQPYPLGHIQSQGSIHPEMVLGGVHRRWDKIGLKIALALHPGSLKRWTNNSIQWLAMTEDLPLPENRVTVEGERVRLHYRPSNLRAHAELRVILRELLRDWGFRWINPQSFGVTNTTHQCGTMVFGTDPRTSVLDPFCRTHDVKNLFVVDASFFPSSAAVNPGLTIAAQALRVADHITATELD